MCLQEVQKYEKVESVNILNDYETTSKKWTDKKKADLIFLFCVFKFQENKFNIVQNNF